MSIGFGPYMSPSRPNTGVATAAVSSVAVIAHDALDGLVFNSFGSSGISGMMSVCISETLMPAADSTAIENAGMRRDVGAEGAADAVTTHGADMYIVSSLCEIAVAGQPSTSARSAGTSSASARPRCDAASFSAARQLGRRPIRTHRHEDRVVAEPAVAARRARDGARPLAAHDGLAAPGRHQRARRHERRTAPLVGHVTAAAPSSSAELATSSPCDPDHRADSTPGMPFSASTASPESSATAANPVARNASRALASAFSSNVAPVSGASSNGATSSSDSSRRPDDARGVEHAAKFGQLLGVAAGHQQIGQLPNAFFAGAGRLGQHAGVRQLQRLALHARTAARTRPAPRRASCPASSAGTSPPRPCPGPRRACRCRWRRRSCRPRRASPRCTAGRCAPGRRPRRRDTAAIAHDSGRGSDSRPAADR